MINHTCGTIKKSKRFEKLETLTNRKIKKVESRNRKIGKSKTIANSEKSQNQNFEKLKNESKTEGWKNRKISKLKNWETEKSKSEFEKSKP